MHEARHLTCMKHATCIASPSSDSRVTCYARPLAAAAAADHWADLAMLTCADEQAPGVNEMPRQGNSIRTLLLICLATQAASNPAPKPLRVLIRSGESHYTLIAQCCHTSAEITSHISHHAHAGPLQAYCACPVSLHLQLH